MKILGIGNAIVDVICKIEDSFLSNHGLTKGTMKLVEKNEFKKLLKNLKIEKTISGGSVANSIVGLSQLGNKVGFIGKVNDDELGRKKIENLIKSIGIFRIKAKSVYLLSKQLIEKHGGKVPDNFEDLEKLPGVGHKTASVVMSQGFGYPAFPVDTHIHRLAQRWGLTNGKNVIQTEEDLKKIFPKRSWNKLHLQIIYYGREYCKARECYGLTCKICTTCYPGRKKPLKTKKA